VEAGRFELPSKVEKK